MCVCLRVCVERRAVPVRRFLWLEIHPDNMKCWCERRGMGRWGDLVCVFLCVYIYVCVHVCVWGVGRSDLRCYLLVSEACLSCTASVMLFHSSFISSTIPFSALTAQFTDTALWEVVFGNLVCACTLSYFFSSAFKLWQRLDQKPVSRIITSEITSNF